jgi:glutamine amidotransferase
MCRLYGFAATQPTRLECSLVQAQNALQMQSDRDGRGRRNADGWGIARWSSVDAEVVRSTQPAFADHGFAREAEATKSQVVLAHVRAATVGDVVDENVHPFRSGPWAFAHNGTLATHAALAPELLDQVHQTPAGTTDSELIFQWILGRMPDYGLHPDRPAESVDPIADLVEQVVLDLVRASIPIPKTDPSKLNFLLTDGVNLVASRWGNTLYWTERNQVRDCAVCGTDHCPEADASYKAVVIASEPITDEHWTEVEEGTIIAVDGNAVVTIHDLATRAA